MKNSFDGFVLAGGKSSRMKTDKAFLKFGDVTFLERAASAVAPSCGAVKIVINENQKEKFRLNFAEFDFVFDFFYERGALGGIHAALKNSNADWAIILACDLPFVTAGAIEKLAQIAVNAPENVSAVVSKQSGGQLQPLCAAYRVKNCLPKIEAIFENEFSVSMRDFLEIIDVKFIEEGELTGDKTRDLFFNVNRPADFQRLHNAGLRFE